MSGKPPSPSARRSRAAGHEPNLLGVVFVHPVDHATFVPFTPGRIVLGRDPAAGMPLDGRAVSWQHAELLTEGDATIIRDLDSTNGVMLGGQRVREARLEEGMLVRLGDFLGVVARASHAAPWPGDDGGTFSEAAREGLVVGPTLGAALAPLAELAVGKPCTLSVEGETGSGKAVVARLAHARVRPRGPFATIDCVAFADNDFDRLLEVGTRGLVYLANLPALAPALQERLLTLLADPAAAKLCLVVGSQEPFTHAVATGQLFAALAARLTGTTVVVPPLRRRMLEIPVLFRALLHKHARRKPPPSLSTELVERLCLYDWPVNAREMVLLAQRLLSLHGDEPRLRIGHLPARYIPIDREGTTLPVMPVASVDERRVLDAVRDSGGDMNGAALRLGITRERAYRLIDRLGLVRGSA